ncbi:hypothetical protein CcaverHIS002_0704180 [Cutaneotrichosporon cavernicola]|nr:hypothetical protein CcaverHIS002_0704180 [Cutaneotrichosporon cavernicola]
MSTSPDSPKFTLPRSSSKMAIGHLVHDVDLSDKDLSDLERELQTRHHERKSLPTEWLIPTRTPSPSELMYVDEVPESPILERPARPVSADSTFDMSFGLRRRAGQILREDRPASCLPSLPHADLTPPPAVPKAKSMSALRVTAEEEMEVNRLLGIQARCAPLSPPLPLTLAALEDVINTSWSEGESQILEPLPVSKRVMNPSVEYGGCDKPLGPVRSPGSKNLTVLVEDWEPESPTPVRTIASQNPRGQPRKSGSASNDVVNGGSNDSAVSKCNLSTTPTIPSRSSSLFVEGPHGNYADHGSPSPVTSQESRHTTAVKQASSMDKAVSSLAEMLKDTLVIADPSERRPSPSSKSDLDFDFPEDAMWSDEVVAGNTAFNNENGHFEQERLLPMGSPVLHESMTWREAHGLTDADWGDANGGGSEMDVGSKDPSSPDLLDIESAFGQRSSFTPAPLGYVHIDELSFSSGALSHLSSGARTDSFGSVVDSDSDGQAHDTDIDGHKPEASIESDPSRAILPCTCCPNPSKMSFLYMHRGPLPTIAEVSDEESPTAQSRFWSTREQLVMASAT